MKHLFYIPCWLFVGLLLAIWHGKWDWYGYNEWVELQENDLV